MNALSFDMQNSLLTKEEINLLPVVIYEGEIVLVKNQTQLEMALAELNKEHVLGFDTETRPTFSKGPQHPPSTLQLSTQRRVFIIQLNHIPFNQELAHLLASQEIVKAGVAIRDDIKALAKICPFTPGSMIDLATMANSKGLQAQGLRTITANLLGYRVSKSVQCSNWSLNTLTEKQIRYAATDAWLGRILYEMLHVLPTVVDIPEIKVKKKRYHRSSKKNKKNIIDE